ncbi:response regulator [Fischerella sp. PCC 9605]|uniref:response regulator n=1 Tax=Fischerella sp. PCC 9605 TaxID=1173024 RepID=UPI0004BA40CA|nr:response regulator [Fischerella sp. PCC 9605]
MIILIDDYDLFRLLMRDLLKGQNYQVIATDNGITGLQLVQEQQPDLIICDTDMPGLNGFDIIEKLHQDLNTTKIPFVLLSYMANNTEREHAIQLGATAYLSKLTPLNQIVEKVASYLNN